MVVVIDDVVVCVDVFLIYIIIMVVMMEVTLYIFEIVNVYIFFSLRRGHLHLVGCIAMLSCCPNDALIKKRFER